MVVSTPNPSPENLINKLDSDVEVIEFLERIKEAPKFDLFAGMKLVDYPKTGFSIYFSDEQKNVLSIFLYGAGHDDHLMYKGVMPGHLSFDDNKDQVLRKLGSPSLSGKERESDCPWERFDLKGYSLHIKYPPDLQCVQMITLMSPAMVRGEI